MWKHKVFCLIERVPESNSSSSSSDSECSKLSVITNDNWIESDDDDALFFPLIQYLTSGRQRHRVENYLGVIYSWTELEFKEHFRLSRRTTYKLIDELERSRFVPQNSFGMKPITGELSILMFLWFMANTEPLRTIADRFNTSISSVFRVVRRVIAWMLTKSEDVIRWPQNHNVMTVCNGFYTKNRISNILGAIDCTHIRIEKPSTNEIDYCNRKKYFSLHLQAVVDSNMQFTNVYCGEPGSLHDARVLRRSPLYNIANEEKETLFPNNTFIIGDSAYPSLPWLVPPFRDNGHLTPQQQEFNYLHSSTRMAVKKAFGLLKGRFRRIKFFSEYRHLSFIVNVVVAACILHNYCVMEKDNFDFDEIDDQFNIDYNPEDNIDNNEIQRDNNLQERRMQLFRELFP